MIRPSKSAGMSQLQALAEYIDQGGNSATLCFYKDSKPSSPNILANNSEKLITIPLLKPCLKSVDDSSIELKPTETAMVMQTGTAIWARLFNGNNETVADFSVGSDVILDNADWAEGGTQKIDSIIFRLAE